MLLFNSVEFLIFFLIVVIIYFLINDRFKWIVLLSSSYYFYMSFKAEYIILLFFSTGVSYCAAIMMEKWRKYRKIILIYALVVNLGMLVLFKYLNFVSKSIVNVLEKIRIHINFTPFDILLPIGISFYTFQVCGYLIDVYRRKIKAERHFGIFATFVSFFPKLVAGPIERGNHLIPQFFKKHVIDPSGIAAGFRLVLWGFFKKLLIADRAGIIVNEVYTFPNLYDGWSLWIATLFFSVQIYTDFSAYTDIARGTSRMLGYHLVRNFQRPYLSSSIVDFWRRWHISLMQWFRDYIYIPLGGKLAKKGKWIKNVLLIFFVSGLWHGANWTFVLWGLIHGGYYILSKELLSMRKKLSQFLGWKHFSATHQLLKTFITFNIVSFLWIFFRSESLVEAIYISKRIIWDVLVVVLVILIVLYILLTFGAWITPLTLKKIEADLKRPFPLFLVLFTIFFLTYLGYGGADYLSILLSPIDSITIFISLFFTIILFIVEYSQERNCDFEQEFKQFPIYVRWMGYYLIIFIILFFGIFREISFIYFKF
ncbi:MAG: MBOAT family O-acyltransferase [Nanoarchaeota archaeon]